MTTEQEMKAALDGWFYSIDYERGATTSTAVALDHIPLHKPRIFDFDEDVVRVNATAHDWDDEQDDHIIQRRSEGVVFKEIGRELGLSESTVQKRYIIVCTQRGIKPMPRNAGRKRKYPEELEGQIVALRGQGKTFTDIADAVKMKRSLVYEIYRTYRVRCDKYRSLERQAA